MAVYRDSGDRIAAWTELGARLLALNPEAFEEAEFLVGKLVESQADLAQLPQCPERIVPLGIGRRIR